MWYNEKKPLKNKRLIRKEELSYLRRLLVCSLASVASITQMIEIHSIWHGQTKHIQKKVKNINLLLLLIILLWTQFPQANKAYLRKSCKNTICLDCTWKNFLFIWFKSCEFYLIHIFSNLLYKMSWKPTFIKVFKKRKRKFLCF